MCERIFRRAKPRGQGIGVALCQLSNLDECEFDEQPFVLAHTVVEVAVGTLADGGVEETWLTALCLLAVTLTNLIARFEQFDGGCITADEQVAQVIVEAGDEMAAFESFGKNFVEGEHDFGDFAVEEVIYQLEVVVMVEDVEVGDGLLISDVSLAKRCHLVEDAEGVSHTSVGLLGDDVEGSRFVGDAFLTGHIFEVPNDVLHGHAVEVVNLAARQDGGQQFVLFGSGEDEDRMSGRFFECLQKCIEGGR